MASLLRDIRFGLKVLRKDRGYAATAILTLAVCIGANTAIFTIVNSVLLRPLPVPESDRILVMSNQYPNAGTGITIMTNSGVPDYYDRLRDVNVFEEQSLFNTPGQTIDVAGTPERVRGMGATPSLFRLLRIAPLYGRIFEDSEGEIGNEQKVLLSYGLWQQLYGGNPAVVGRELRLTGRPFTIVGVMPQNFSFFDSEVRFWTPLAFTAQQKSDDARHDNSWHNIGRLKRGATRDQAQAQVNALNAANLERFPKLKQALINAGFYTKVEPLQDMLVRDVKPMLFMLWGAAAFVLLIGAVNLANLALARSNFRVKERATRVALGARRAQVARQLLVESLLLSSAGGLAGIALASWILQALTAIGLERLPRASEIHIDVSVIAFALALSIGVGALIGVGAVMHLFSVNLNRLLHEEDRTGTSSRKVRTIRRGLVITQVAFAFVLLIGAGLLLASFRQILAIDPGFRDEGVITASINVPRERYTTDADMQAFTDRALQAIRTVPGVVTAGATTTIPLGGSHTDSVILAEGYVMKPGESLVSPNRLSVTPGYFQAMSTSLVRGRYFDERDNATAPGAVIVSDRLAHKFWSGVDPIGKRMFRPENPSDLFKTDKNTHWLTVVGVVRDVQLDRLGGNENAVGAYYFPYAQSPTRNYVFAIKTLGYTASVMRTVRAEIARIDPEIPLFGIRTMTEVVDRALMARKAAMLLAVTFACIALLLSALGIYGVLAYLVGQRRREIGIRIAMGSTPQGIFNLVLREGVILIAAGLVLGLAGSVALRNALRSQIYGVRPTDPLVTGIVIAVLALIALAACVVPARRATKVDPVIVLNQE